MSNTDIPAKDNEETQNIFENMLIFEKSVTGRKGTTIPKSDVPSAPNLPSQLRRKQNPKLPEISESEVVRHFTCLSRKNFSVDTNFYPLGSCTMKYNPKILEKTSALPGFVQIHPHLPRIKGAEPYIQGALSLLAELNDLLAKITGMKEYSFQPMAGAHGEWLGMQLFKAYHTANGNKKTHVLVPDSAHGTNPASAVMAGYKVVTIPSTENGTVNIEAFKEKINSETAGIMLTCPNTLGIFEDEIKTIADEAHNHDALLYYDGANLNAILGRVRPGDLGFDIVHLNVHKTFATPHGGGGPGAGPVGVCERLTPYLPVPRVTKENDEYNVMWDSPETIGMIAQLFGNFGILIRAYTYILISGKDGLEGVSRDAVLNARYILENLKSHYDIPYSEGCLHECVFSASRQQQYGIKALDIAKYLIDQGIHPPTVYFPLIVEEAMMTEPTETETRETLDRFIHVMQEAAKLAEENPEYLHNAPYNTPIHRLDETKAAREARVRWE